MTQPFLTVFLGTCAIAPEAAWADFQRAADASEEEGRAHVWWTVERELFDHYVADRPGGSRPLDTLLGIALDRPILGATATHELGYDRGQWVPAITFRPGDIRTADGSPVPWPELVAAGKRIAAALGIALGRNWVEWLAPVAAPAGANDPREEV